MNKPRSPPTIPRGQGPAHLDGRQADPHEVSRGQAFAGQRTIEHHGRRRECKRDLGRHRDGRAASRVHETIGSPGRSQQRDRDISVRQVGEERTPIKLPPLDRKANTPGSESRGAGDRPQVAGRSADRGRLHVDSLRRANSSTRGESQSSPSPAHAGFRSEARRERSFRALEREHRAR